MRASGKLEALVLKKPARLLTVLLVILGTGILAGNARAGGPPIRPPEPPAPHDPSVYITYPDLDRLASVFAMRPVSVHCVNPVDDGMLGDAYGYTYVFPEWDHTVVRSELCDDLEYGGMDDQVALAMLVIVHESYHLRRWNLRQNEAAVECRAVRHWHVAMRLFGFPLDITDRLFPWALTFHYREELFPAYRSLTCKVPGP